jgi:hypothetical protein
MGRGLSRRVVQARAAADRLMEIGRLTNEPRSLGYGAAMKAIIAMVTDDYEPAIEMAELALHASLAPFEKAIAASAKYAALALLNRPGAVEQVGRYVAMCEENGWILFLSGPETLVGVALATAGRIDDALHHIEAAIVRREKEGYRAAADWGRFYLCEIYLAVLSGEGRRLARRARPQHSLCRGRRLVRPAAHPVARRGGAREYAIRPGRALLRPHRNDPRSAL